MTTWMDFGFSSKSVVFETRATARLLGYFLWADCYVLFEIVYCISNRVGSKIESPLDSVVGDWEDHDDFVYVGCKLTVNWNWIKWFEKRICCSNHQPKGNAYVYSIFGLYFLEQVRMCLVVIGGEISQKWKWLFFSVVATRLSCKAMCSITAKQHKCRYLVLKRNFQNVAACFALFTVVETSRFIGWKVNTLFVSTCGRIHISDSFSYFVIHAQFFLSIIGWLSRDFIAQLFVV